MIQVSIINDVLTTVNLFVTKFKCIKIYVRC